MDQTFRPLLDALKQIGIDPVAVDAAADEAQRSGRSVRAVLINDQVVTEEQLTQAAAAAFGINTLDLVGFTPDPQALKRIPLSVVLRHRVLGLAINDGELVVGVTDPADVVALDDVRAATGMTIRPVVVAIWRRTDSSVTITGRIVITCRMWLTAKVLSSSSPMAGATTTRPRPVGIWCSSTPRISRSVVIPVSATNTLGCRSTDQPVVGSVTRSAVAYPRSITVVSGEPIAARSSSRSAVERSVEVASGGGRRACSSDR
jgi:hypothetical protein